MSIANIPALTPRDILVRALDCISADGYVTKDKALYSGERSTADKVLSSFEIFPTLRDEESSKHGDTADKVIEWINKVFIDNDYLDNCRKAVNSDGDASRYIGLLSSLPAAYERDVKYTHGLDRVTQVNAFAADAGHQYAGDVEVVNVINFEDYVKVNTVDAGGYLIGFSISKGSKALTGDLSLDKIVIGAKLHVEAKVYRNKFTTPFETTLSRPTLRLL